MKNIRIELLLALAVSVQGQSVQQAYQLQQSGDYAGAAEAYRAFLKLNPNEPGARSNLGVVLVQLGRFDEAITEYEAAAKLLPDDRRIALNLALAYQKSGRLTQASAKFESLHAAEPDDNQVTLLLADCRLQMGDDAQVIDLLRPMEQKSSADLGVAYMLGTALIRQKRIDEGQVLLDRILKHGDSPEARFLLGTRMFQSGDYPAAVKQLASAIELNPKLPGLQSFYGQALLNTGDPDAAGTAFRNELMDNPNDFAANLGLGQILTVRKKYDEAAPLLERALLLLPQSADAQLAIAECLTGQGRLPEARKRLEALLPSLPDSLQAHRDLAEVYTRLHLTHDAAQERAAVQRLQGAAPGPKVNDVAPEFLLRDASGANVDLRAFHGNKPMVLVFGSYTCPNFRASAGALNALHAKFGARAPFLLVYIREAHAGKSTWQSTRNQRDNIDLPPAMTLGDRQQHAAMCTRRLHLAFPAVADKMDGTVEAAYAAWPSRAFVIGADGRIMYSTRLTELDFRAEEMEAALKKAVSAELVEGKL